MSCAIPASAASTALDRDDARLVLRVAARRRLARLLLLLRFAISLPHGHNATEGPLNRAQGTGGCRPAKSRVHGVRAGRWTSSTLTAYCPRHRERGGDGGSVVVENRATSEAGGAPPSRETDRGRVLHR